MNPSEKPTPETDAAEEDCRNIEDPCVVSSDFARGLERRLSAAYDQLMAVLEREDGR